MSEVVIETVVAPKERKYGWKRDQLDPRDKKLKFSGAAVKDLPLVVDHRPHMPPVWDQGDIGRCTGAATGSQCWFADKTNPFEPSMQFIYYTTRMLEGTVNYDSGASIRNSIKSVVRYGFPPETEWPRDMPFRKKPPQKVFNIARKELVTSYAKLQLKEDQLRAALAQGFTVNLGIMVYASFESPETAATGVVVTPNPAKERQLGGHAILICGFDHEQRKYIARNSWSAAWGDKGYFYIDYDYIHNTDLTADPWVIKSVP